RNGEAAKKFDAVKVFHDYFSEIAKEKGKFAGVQKEKVAYYASLKPKVTKTSTGLEYIITEKGTGKKPAIGTQLYIHYAGFLEDGTLFDTSIEDVAKTYGKFDQARAEAKAYQPIPFQAGRKDGMIPGFIEGIEQLSFGDKAVIFIPSHLAYGQTGAGGVIPPNANIIFEIQLLEKPQ
ncbi:MAG: FKBP-type peptidyl-prolyl cis-trans isomerase, partial [Flavobacterium sp.]